MWWMRNQCSKLIAWVDWLHQVMGLHLHVNIYLKINLDNFKEMETQFDSKYCFLKRLNWGFKKNMIKRLV